MQQDPGKRAGKFVSTRRFSSIPLLLLAFGGFARAGSIDLSSGNTFTLTQGQELVLRFSVWNYGVNNPGVSPYPTSIGLELVGANPSGGLATIPGSSSQYYSGYQLQGTLESMDGTTSAPLMSPAAALLGFSPGTLVLTPETYYGNGSATPVAAVEAQAALSLSLSEQIFGPNVASRQSSALIVLHNLGSDLVIGMGNGRSLRSAITEPSVTGLGAVQTSGITQSLSAVDVPEPSAVSLLGGLGLIAAVWLLVKRRRRAI